jgi:hypothetical protein
MPTVLALINICLNQSGGGLAPLAGQPRHLLNHLKSRIVTLGATLLQKLNQLMGGLLNYAHAGRVVQGAHIGFEVG